MIIIHHVHSVIDARPGFAGLMGPLEPIFSGLFSYHVPTNTWIKLADDASWANPSSGPSIRSRVGHSMLFHPVSSLFYKNYLYCTVIIGFSEKVANIICIILLIIIFDYFNICILMLNYSSSLFVQSLI